MTTKILFYNIENKFLHYSHQCNNAPSGYNIIQIPLSDEWYNENKKTGLILLCPYCGLDVGYKLRG